MKKNWNLRVKLNHNDGYTFSAWKRIKLMTDSIIFTAITNLLIIFIEMQYILKVTDPYLLLFLFSIILLLSLLFLPLSKSLSFHIFHVFPSFPNLLSLLLSPLSLSPFTTTPPFPPYLTLPYLPLPSLSLLPATNSPSFPQFALRYKWWWTELNQCLRKTVLMWLWFVKLWRPIQ